MKQQLIVVAVLTCLLANGVTLEAATLSKASVDVAVADLTSTSVTMTLTPELSSETKDASEEKEDQEDKKEDSEEDKEDDEDKEDSEDKEDDEDDDDEKEAKTTEENTPVAEVAPMSVEELENSLSAAGLTYNKETDLPVFSLRKAFDKDALPPVPQIISCRTGGQIAITYSEGPSNTTARIARQLNADSVPGNFFVNPKSLKMQQYAGVLRTIYNGGHFIGMTYTIPPSSLSDEAMKEDIINSAKAIQSIIGVSPKYVRLHFSAQNDGRAEHIFHDLGFVLVGYNLDGKDYVHKTPELIQQEYEKTFISWRSQHDKEDMGSFISIQYDIPETKSLEAVAGVVSTIKKEGYVPVRMDNCLNDRKPYKLTSEGSEYVNDKFSFGNSAGDNKAEGNIKKKGNSMILNKDAKSNTDADQQQASVAAIAKKKTSGAVSVKAKVGVLLVPAILYAAINLFF